MPSLGYHALLRLPCPPPLARLAVTESFGFPSSAHSQIAHRPALSLRSTTPIRVRVRVKVRVRVRPSLSLRSTTLTRQQPHRFSGSLMMHVRTSLSPHRFSGSLMMHVRTSLSDFQPNPNPTRLPQLLYHCSHSYCQTQRLLLTLTRTHLTLTHVTLTHLTLTHLTLIHGCSLSLKTISRRLPFLSVAKMNHRQF